MKGNVKVQVTRACLPTPSLKFDLELEPVELHLKCSGLLIIRQYGSGNSCVNRHIIGDPILCVLPQLHEKLSQMEIHAGSSLTEAIISIRKHERPLFEKEILY